MNPKDRAYAVFKLPRIVLYPSRASFVVPASFLDWYTLLGDNIHCTPAQLENVADGKGEWTTEYASVCNAVFPFDLCAVHTGNAGWHGPGGSEFQLRVYQLKESVQEVTQQLLDKGRQEVLRITSKEITPTREVLRNWKRVKLSFWLWYSDYGGFANVDCFLREHENRAIVFCFMYNDPRHTDPMIREVLDSFDMGEKALGPLPGNKKK